MFFPLPSNYSSLWINTHCICLTDYLLCNQYTLNTHYAAQLHALKWVVITGKIQEIATLSSCTGMALNYYTARSNTRLFARSASNCIHVHGTHIAKEKEKRTGFESALNIEGTGRVGLGNGTGKMV